jgi:hypothetical protein
MVLDGGGHMDHNHVSRLAASNGRERMGAVCEVVEAAADGTRQHPTPGTWRW